MPMGLAVGFQPQLRLKMCLLLCLPKTMELVLDLRPRLQLRMCLLLCLPKTHWRTTNWKTNLTLDAALELEGGREY